MSRNWYKRTYVLKLLSLYLDMTCVRHLYAKFQYIYMIYLISFILIFGCSINTNFSCIKGIVNCITQRERIYFRSPKMYPPGVYTQFIRHELNIPMYTKNSKHISTVECCVHIPIQVTI